MLIRTISYLLIHLYTTKEASSTRTFCCRKCGYEAHANHNAAKNIGIEHGGTEVSPWTGDRQLTLKSER